MSILRKQICIIPARGGSRRIKNKNIKKFNGKPIISYSIDSAKKTNLFSEIIISSDSKSIKKVINKIPKTFFLKRPKKLSGDKTLTRPVIKHALEQYSKKGINPSYICYITATAPFIRYKDIIDAFKILKKNKKINFVVSVTKFSYPLLRSLRISKKGTISFWKKKYMSKRSQDLEQFYHDAGQFYWARSDAIKKNLSTFSDKTLPFVIPNYRVIDIDDNEDWKNAELMSKYL